MEVVFAVAVMATLCTIGCIGSAIVHILDGEEFKLGNKIIRRRMK